MAKKKTKKQLEAERRASKGKNNKNVKNNKSNKNRKKRSGCGGCLGCLIVPLALVAVILVGGYFVGDYFAKEHLDIGMGDIVSTIGGILNADEDKIVTNPYENEDLGRLESALKDALLLADDYKIPFEEMASGEIEPDSLLSALLNSDNFDTSKLSTFVYEGDGVTDTRLRLNDKGLAALIDSLVPAIKQMLAENGTLPAGIPAEALSIGIPQITFGISDNPNYVEPTDQTIVTTADEDDDQTDPNADPNTDPNATEPETEPAPFVEPKEIYSLKVTVKIGLRDIGKYLLQQEMPDYEPLISWAIPKNMFVTAKIALNTKATPVITINAMTEDHMNKMIHAVDKLDEKLGMGIGLGKILDDLGETIFKTLNDAGITSLFEFEEISTETFMRMDLIKTAMGFAGINDIESKDIFLVLKVLLVDSANVSEIEIDLDEQRGKLNDEFQDKYLLKEDKEVSDLINMVMGGSKEPEDDQDDIITTSITTSITTTSTDSANEMFDYVDLNEINKLYKLDNASDADLMLTGGMLTVLMKDVMDTMDLDLGGMEFDFSSVGIEMKERDTVDENENPITVTEAWLNLSVVLNPQKMVADMLGADSESEGDVMMSFIKGLLPTAMYLKVSINIDNRNDDVDIVVNNSEYTDKVFSILGKVAGGDFSVDDLTEPIGDTIHDMFDEIRDMIGLEFVTETEGEVEVHYARLANLFKLIATFMDIKVKNAEGEEVLIEDNTLKTLLSGLQISQEEGDTADIKESNNVLNELFTGTTYAQYQATLATAKDDFSDDINQKYFMTKDGNGDYPIDVDQMLNGKLDGDVIKVENIDGVKLRNYEGNDLQPTLTNEAFTSIASGFLKGTETNSTPEPTAFRGIVRTEDEEPEPSSGGMSDAITLERAEFSIPDAGQPTQVRLDVMLSVDIKGYITLDETLSGLVPDIMYITAVIAWDSTETDLLNEDNVTFEINLLNKGSLLNQEAGKTNTDLLLDVMNAFGGGLDFNSIKGELANGIKDSLVELEKLCDDGAGGVSRMYTGNGIELPNIFEMMVKFLPNADDADKLNAEELRDVIQGLENDTGFVDADGNADISAEGYYPSLGDYVTEVDGVYAYDEEGYENAVKAYLGEWLPEVDGEGHAKLDDEGNPIYKYQNGIVPTAEEGFSTDVTDKYFLEGGLDIKDIFNADAFNFDEMSKFDGAKMRAETRTLEQMKVELKELALINVINNEIDRDGSSGEESFKYSIIGVDVELDTESGAEDFVIFTMILEVSVDDMEGMGSVMPQKIYVNATINFNATTAKEANNNRIADNDNKPTVDITVNQFTKNGESSGTSMDKFNKLMNMAGASFSFDSVGDQLLENLLPTLADMEDSVKSGYSDNGIVLPTVYDIILSAINGRENATEITLTALDVKELFENMYASSTYVLNENGDGNKIVNIYSAGEGLGYPVPMDYKNDSSLQDKEIDDPDNAGATIPNPYYQDFGYDVTAYQYQLELLEAKKTIATAQFDADVAEYYFFSGDAPTVAKMTSSEGASYFANAENEELKTRFNLGDFTQIMDEPGGLLGEIVPALYPDGYRFKAEHPTWAKKVVGENFENEKLLQHPSLNGYAISKVISGDFTPEDTGFGEIQEYSVVTAKIYNKSNIYYMDFVIKIVVSNDSMKALMPSDFYVTVTIEYDDTVGEWQEIAGGSDFNNLTKKLHSTGEGTPRNMYDTFNTLVNSGFGNGSSFDELTSNIAQSASDALNNVSNNLEFTPATQSFVMTEAELNGAFSYESTGDITEADLGVLQLPNTLGMFGKVLGGTFNSPYQLLRGLDRFYLTGGDLDAAFQEFSNLYYIANENKVETVQ